MYLDFWELNCAQVIDFSFEVFVVYLLLPNFLSFDNLIFTIEPHSLAFSDSTSYGGALANVFL